MHAGALEVQPFQKFFTSESVDRGNEHQKVLIDSLEWKNIEQRGSLLYDPTSKENLGHFMAEY
jgi:hypothetical protein